MWMEWGYCKHVFQGTGKTSVQLFVCDFSVSNSHMEIWALTECSKWLIDEVITKTVISIEKKI